MEGSCEQVLFYKASGS